MASDGYGAADHVRRWRLGFPADGSAVFELTGAFDDGAVVALLPRMAELTAHEPRGLVIDLSDAGDLDAAGRERLLGVVGSAPRCLLVVVTPSAARLGDSLAYAGSDRPVIAVETAAAARRVLRGGRAYPVHDLRPRDLPR